MIDGIRMTGSAISKLADSRPVFVPRSAEALCQQFDALGMISKSLQGKITSLYRLVSLLAWRAFGQRRCCTMSFGTTYPLRRRSTWEL